MDQKLTFATLNNTPQLICEVAKRWAKPRFEGGGLPALSRIGRKGIQEAKRPHEGSRQDFERASKGRFQNNRPNPDFCNTSKPILPFQRWSGPSNSGSAGQNRPNHIRGNANPWKIKRLGPEVVQFPKQSC